MPSKPSRLWYEVSAVLQFFGTGRECFMRLNVRMYNPGINSVRLDALTVTSHSPDWSAEIDRLEYRPNPAGIMAPCSGQDLRLNGILLEANGNQNSWSYRWALNWSYTVWRPSAAAFPLGAAEPRQTEAGGQQSQSRTVRGGADLRRQSAATAEAGAADAEFARPFCSGQWHARRQHRHRPPEPLHPHPVNERRCGADA